LEREIVKFSDYLKHSIFDQRLYFGFGLCLGASASKGIGPAFIVGLITFSVYWFYEPNYLKFDSQSFVADQDPFNGINRKEKPIQHFAVSYPNLFRNIKYFTYFMWLLYHFCDFVIKCLLKAHRIVFAAIYLFSVFSKVERPRRRNFGMEPNFDSQSSNARVVNLSKQEMKVRRKYMNRVNLVLQSLWDRNLLKVNVESIFDQAYLITRQVVMGGIDDKIIQQFATQVKKALDGLPSVYTMVDLPEEQLDRVSLVQTDDIQEHVSLPSPPPSVSVHISQTEISTSTLLREVLMAVLPILLRRLDVSDFESQSGKSPDAQHQELLDLLSDYLENGLDNLPVVPVPQGQESYVAPEPQSVMPMEVLELPHVERHNLPFDFGQEGCLFTNYRIVKFPISGKDKGEYFVVYPTPDCYWVYYSGNTHVLSCTILAQFKVLRTLLQDVFRLTNSIMYCGKYSTLLKFLAEKGVNSRTDVLRPSAAPMYSNMEAVSKP
jgi:hypothetical protein